MDRTHDVQHLVVMGVAGCGKSTLGENLAERLQWPFAEGDRFHPAANVEKMSAGFALDDADRRPWLRALADWIAARDKEGQNSVTACSSLKRSYRDILRSGAPWVRFVHLHGSRSALEDRLASRSGHFFPAALLDDQFATLEPLEDDEDGVIVDVRLDRGAQLATALAKLGLS